MTEKLTGGHYVERDDGAVAEDHRDPEVGEERVEQQRPGAPQGKGTVLVTEGSGAHTAKALSHFMVCSVLPVSSTSAIATLVNRKGKAVPLCLSEDRQ